MKIKQFTSFAAMAMALACNIALAQTPTARTGASAIDDAALAALRQKAEGGDAEAQFKLAGMLDSGQGVRQDLEQAALWLRRAAEQRHADAELALGDSLQEGRGQAEDQAAAKGWKRKACEHGAARACMELAERSYRWGAPSSDQGEALKWYGAAAELGDIKGQYHYGRLLRYRAGPDDAAKAILWLRRAAEQGNADAQNELADVYIKGDLVPKDVALAVPLLKQAAAQGQHQAQLKLGRLYASGDGVALDEREALRLLQLVAEAWPYTAVELGDMYQFAKTIRPNYREAEKWYLRANGDTAWLRLGQLYESNKMGPRDVVKAREFYLRAADWGNSEARLAIGRQFLNGIGVKHSDRQAYVWFELARVAVSNQPAQYRNAAMEKTGAEAERLMADLAKRMSKKDVTAARTDAAGWQPKIPPVEVNVQQPYDVDVVEWTRLYDLAVAAYKAGRYRDAAGEGAKAVVIAEQHQGVKSSRLILSLINMFNISLAEGRYDDGEAYLLRILKLRETALGSKHKNVAATLQYLASFYQQTGQSAKAQACKARILANQAR